MCDLDPFQCFRQSARIRVVAAIRDAQNDKVNKFGGLFRLTMGTDDPWPNESLICPSYVASWRRGRAAAEEHKSMCQGALPCGAFGRFPKRTRREQFPKESARLVLWLRHLGAH